MRDVSTSQAAGMEQADVAIARIAEVVQANSATSQETSATSEELTAHALYMIEVEHATSVSYTADMVNELF